MEEQKLNIPGVGEVTGQEVLAKTHVAPEIEVDLEDGTKVKFKPRLTKALRTEHFSDDGAPRYAFQIELDILSVQVPDELKKKKVQ